MRIIIHNPPYPQSSLWGINEILCMKIIRVTIKCFLSITSWFFFMPSASIRVSQIITSRLLFPWVPIQLYSADNSPTMDIIWTSSGYSHFLIIQTRSNSMCLIYYSKRKCLKLPDTFSLSWSFGNFVLPFLWCCTEILFSCQNTLL